MQKLYYGGDIITMRAETDAPEALLVSDGKIAYVGELLEARKRCLPGAEEIDLGGRTLMPSFIDAHSHIAMLAQYTDFVNLIFATFYGWNNLDYLSFLIAFFWIYISSIQRHFIVTSFWIIYWIQFNFCSHINI